MEDIHVNLGNATIGQVLVPVRDLERAVAFYRDTLGLRLLFTAPPGMAFLQCGGVRVLLGAVTDRDLGPQESAVYFFVHDIASVYETLRARGVAFGEEPTVIHRAGTREIWLAEFSDPDGNHLALMAEKEADVDGSTEVAR